PLAQLIDLSQSADPVARWMAVQAIGWTHTSDKDALLAVARGMQDPHTTVRVCAAAANWELTGKVEPALTTLMEALRAPDSPWYTMPASGISVRQPSHRLCAVHAIGRMGPAAAGRAVELCALLDSDDLAMVVLLPRTLRQIAPRSPDVVRA